jgi:hypothetical protein
MERRDLAGSKKAGIMHTRSMNSEEQDIDYIPRTLAGAL